MLGLSKEELQLIGVNRRLEILESKLEQAIKFIESFEEFYQEPYEGEDRLFNSGANCMRNIANRDLQMVKRILKDEVIEDVQ